MVRFCNAAVLPGLAAAMFLVGSMGSVQAADPLPKVRVGEVRLAYTSDSHNAFTDLCKFQGRYYLTFRTCPDGHAVNPTSHILVLVSDDTKEWKEAFRFHVPQRDVRDPHFLIFRDKLFIYSGCWLAPRQDEAREFSEHLGFAVWTEDGQKWHGPQALEGTYGHYIWRATASDDKAYLCARRKRDFVPTATRAERDQVVQSALLESEDGLIWKFAGIMQSDRGNETALLLEPDGTMLAVARGSSGQLAQVCRSQPPYRDFSRVEMNRNVGGPLLVRWNDHLLVGGRKTVDGDPKTALYWLSGDKLHEFAVLPSGGDNSYPGFVQLDEKRALLSYYSSHQGDGDPKTRAAIYLVELELE
ncbi:hypothetical protein [Lignipirellula cremea]|uniref:Sialidase domain-containing protein n=1 Tax=Lignipirellula cremea TaxID=2528010 RepID=A0A518E310_9BACT|nr:hypothetical protein [Lignipirellula cremea]QDU98452.1 hypothetical protein Pla8534_63200 [Lignipirellula cremea]